MARPDPLRPQLCMRCPDLSAVPEPELPDGFTYRHFQPGDEPAWVAIIEDSFGSPLGEDGFRRRMRDEQFRPERVWFVCDGKTPVATASAWFAPEWGQAVGVLHMVGCRSDYRGRRLGREVSVAALAQMRREGRSEAVLRTDDFRIPAIRTYLQLGFRPLIVHPNQPARWRRALPRAGVREVEAAYGAELAAAPYRPPGSGNDPRRPKGGGEPSDTSSDADSEL